MQVEIPDPIWVLYLNDMRFAHVEELVPVFRASTKEALVAFLEREKVPTYVEDGFGTYGETKWHKSYRKGGPLEWFNQPDSVHPSFRQCNFEAVIQGFVRDVMCIPPTPTT